MRSKKNIIFFSIAFLTVFFTSCSSHMIGTWSVNKYTAVSPGQQEVVLENIGTMQFNKNGYGEKNLSYSIMGSSESDTGPFKWTWHKSKLITIESSGSPSKTWIIIENKAKYQKWQSTNGTTEVQTLELKKQSKTNP